MLRERAMRGEIRPRTCAGSARAGADVPAGRRVRHDGHEGARAAPRSRGHGEGRALSDAGLLWEAELRTSSSPGILSRLQPLDRRLLPRLRRTAHPHRASLARRSTPGRARARARGAGRLPRRVRVPVHDHARAPRRSRSRRASSPPRRTWTFRSRSIRRSSRPRGTSIIASTSSAGRCGTSISSRATACSTPSRRSSSSASSTASRACASSCSNPGRLDRLLPRPRRCHLRRDLARRHRAG